MFTEYLDRIDDFCKSIGIVSKRVGATEEQIRHIVDRANKELNCGLPEDYIGFLRLTNGFNYNGYFIYCIDDTGFYLGDGIASGKKMPGIIERTLMWRQDDEEYKNWVFFGNSDMDLYVYNGDVNGYWQYNVSGDVIDTFSTFTEMAEKMLSDALKY